MKKIYENRPFSEGYPDLEKLGVEYFKNHQGTTSNITETMTCIGRLIDLSEGLSTVCVVGCGPNPTSVKELLALGYDAVGVEPVDGSANAAANFVGDKNRIINASAERLSLPDNSQRVVLFESVFEHVDSPFKSLLEGYRVLAPGGVLFIHTTNRYRFSLTGYNGEFNVKFYNWLPATIKESYIFKHLHYDPRLANYSPRPAVHWFTYADLCNLGRFVGFSQFYSPLDLLDSDSVSIRKSPLRRFFLNKIRYNTWLRALALMQFGNAIYMLKRNE